MSKKVKVPRTRLSVEKNAYSGDYELWFYVDGFEAMPVHNYTKRSDAVRGARRFAGRLFEIFFDRPEYVPIYVDGDKIL